jgi:hypothetical protein
VIGIQYHPNDPTYCTLTLELIDEKSSQEIASSMETEHMEDENNEVVQNSKDQVQKRIISVNYHASSEFADFIILANRVKKAMNTDWKEVFII